MNRERTAFSVIPIVLAFALGLVPATATLGQTRIVWLSEKSMPVALRHPEYELRSFAESDFTNEKQKLLVEQLMEAARGTKSDGFKNALAYLDLATFINHKFGHHDFAFKLAERASEIASRLPRAKATSELILAATALIEKMARARLLAMRDTWSARADSRLRLVPEKNKLTIYSHPGGTNNKKTILVFDAFHPVFLVDIVNGYLEINIVRFEAPDRIDQQSYWVRADAEEFQGLVLRPPGLVVWMRTYKSDEVEQWQFMNYYFTGDAVQVSSVSLADKILGIQALARRFEFLSPEAEKTIDDISFSYAADRYTEESAREYLFKFGEKGRHYQEATKLLEMTIWQQVNNAGSMAEYERYITAYPEGDRVLRAREQIEELTFRGASSPSLLGEYLAKYPEGTFREEAEKKLDEARFADAKSKGTPEALEHFLEEYPKSRFEKQAQADRHQFLESRDFAASRLANSADAYRVFLERYPDTVYKAEVEAALLSLEAQRSPSLENLQKYFRSYRAVKDKNKGVDGYDRMIELLSDLAIGDGSSSHESMEAIFLLYEETGEKGLIYKAWNEDLARNATEEFRILKELPPSELKKIFALVPIQGSQSMGEDWDATAFGNIFTTAKPSIPAKVRSTTRFTGVKMQIRMRLKVNYEKYWYGITWFEPPGSKPKYWSQTYDVDVWFEIPASGESRTRWFDFPEFETTRESGLTGAYSWRTKATVNEPEIIIAKLEQLP